jgi:regulator of protease activity HflC (stomatin/prohibitin superfamily)
LFQFMTVWEYEKGLKYHNGRFKEVLGAGRYLIYTPSSHITRVDIRPQFTIVTGQEVLSADGIALKVSLVVRYSVADPVTAINSNKDYLNTVYLLTQIALRDVIGSGPIDELLENRKSFDSILAEKCRQDVEELGLKLLSICIRDITFPGDLKKVFAQVVKARKEGLAALERARGETAALRNLANAAKMLESNPTLLQLRMIQTLGESSGNTVVMGLPKPENVLPLQSGKESIEKPKGTPS